MASLQDEQTARDAYQRASIEPQDRATPDDTFDDIAKKLYRQAEGHRDILVKFYIHYIIWFTIAVFLLIFSQSLIRAIYPKRNSFEIMPRWTLNILVTGMFVNFIGLLKIVTQNVWDYKKLLDYLGQRHKDHNDSADL